MSTVCDKRELFWRRFGGFRLGEVARIMARHLA
jgi:hypothetical protein